MNGFPVRLALALRRERGIIPPYSLMIAVATTEGPSDPGLYAVFSETSRLNWRRDLMSANCLAAVACLNRIVALVLALKLCFIDNSSDMIYLLLQCSQFFLKPLDFFVDRLYSKRFNFCYHSS